jgi:general secretion pathway protein H
MAASGQLSSKTGSRDCGFTLIELLVVTTMIGLLVGLALLSFSTIGSDRAVQQQATRLLAILELSSEEAQMQGRDFGLELMQRGYRFVEYDPLLDTWSEVLGDDLMKSRELDESMEFELTLEDRRVLLPQQAQETKSDEDDDEGTDKRDLTDDYLPHVLIMSSGDVTPFELQIVRDFDKARAGIEANAAGELGLVDDERDP